MGQFIQEICSSVYKLYLQLQHASDTDKPKVIILENDTGTLNVIFCFKVKSS